MSRNYNKSIRTLFIIVILSIASFIFYTYALPLIDDYLRKNIWVPIALGLIVILALVIILYKASTGIRFLLSCVVSYIKEQYKKFFKGKQEPPVELPKSIRIPLQQKHISALLERAYHRCQSPRCFRSESLQIHHIDKKRYNPKSSNLIVLCPNHHTSADNNQWRKETLSYYNRRNNYYDYKGNRCNGWSQRQIKDNEFTYNINR